MTSDSRLAFVTLIKIATMSALEEEEKVDRLSSNSDEEPTKKDPETLPASFHSNGDNHKLGFSIATIMGFMGTKSSEKDVKEDIDIEPKVEKDEKPLPPPPKLWRPQPFRDFSPTPSHARYEFIF